MLRRSKSFATGTAWLMALGISWLSVATVATAATGSQRGPGRQAHRFSGRLPGKPAYVWLWYADGGPFPDYTEYCGNYTPPAYQCNFGSSLQDCQAQVQTYLDVWYNDFNLVFTLTRPPTADYYPLIVTSSWPACKVEAADRTGGIAANEGGISPSSCNDNPGQTAIAIECGKNAHDCATIIAHEHGHLVGLVHTTSSTDVMNEWVRATAAGFVDQSLPTVQDSFNTCEVGKQNSYQLMLSALGAWTGDTKPGPVFSTTDAGVTDGGSADAGDAATHDATHDTPDAPATGSVVGPGLGPSIDGSVTVLPGFDAYSRTPPSAMPDAGASTTATQKGGCDFARTPTSASLLFVAAFLLGYRLLSRRAALSRTSRSCRTATRRS
jgi:hypothetical protein